MSGPGPGGPATDPAAAETCAQCSKPIVPPDRVASGGKLFCRSCYTSLRAELEHHVEVMSSDANYVNGAAGALLGGAAGAMAWWGFTVVTKLGLGLLAIAIGYLAGTGAVRFAGGKRSGGLQAVAVTAAALSYAVATYLVNMTFINRSLASSGQAFRVVFPAAEPAAGRARAHGEFEPDGPGVPRHRALPGVEDPQAAQAAAGRRLSLPAHTS